MSKRPRASLLPWLVGGVGFAAGVYGALAANAWLRYGHPAEPRQDEADPLLDRFMPGFDIVERHHIHVNAPASMTLQAARDVNLFGPTLVRSVFRTRELVLGANRAAGNQPTRLVPWAESLGWGVLAERPECELVMGAVTQPWKANVVFRPLPPDRFREFDTPGYVKIAWTLRADPVGDRSSIFRSETRAVATDAAARAQFRRYWSFVAPGVWVIRRLTLQPVKRSAESLARVTAVAGVARAPLLV